MRILQINKYSTINGGSEVVADIVARAGSNAGHQVLTVGFSNAGQAPIQGSLDLGPERISVPGMFRNTALVEQVATIAKEFRPDAILHHNVYHHFPMAQLVERLKQTIDAPQSIILHDHKPVCPTYTGLRDGKPCRECSGGRFWHAASHRCKNGSLVSSTLLTLDSYWNASVRKVYGRFHQVISPSAFLARNVERMGIGRQVCSLMNPCPPVDDAILPRSGILFASRLVEEKGVDVLLHLAESLPRTAFLVAGDGPLADKVKSFAQDHSNVTILGRLSRDEVWSTLAKARYLLLPSIGMENNPMIALESLARGTPILGSNRGGVPELIEGGHGSIFDPSDLRKTIEIVSAAIDASDADWQASSRTCIDFARANDETAYVGKLGQLLLRDR